jgi:hypothetical protein
MKSNEARYKLGLHRLGKRLSPKDVSNLRQQAHYDEDYIPHFERREELKKDIEELSLDGKLAVYHWARDCDHYESAHVEWIPALVPAFIYRENMYERSAEGPWTFCIIEPDEAKDFQFWSRDRAAEMMGY